jgi:nitrite reductase/ring-hydroxylating ferredoxin subunit
MITRDTEHLTVPPDGGPFDEQPKWRQDFPIDWSQDHYISRRDFTKFMVLTSLAFAVGQIWIGARNIMRRRRGDAAILQVATIDQIPVGGALAFNYPAAHDSCLLMRAGENKFVAFSQKCTHLSCAVVPQSEKGRFFCPCHEGAFDLHTGVPIAGPPRRPLPTITLEIHGDAIYATGVTMRMI